MTSYGYLNGEFAEIEKLKISVMDRGFIYGDGCYEVIPVYHKKPFGLKRHLIRLLQSLQKINLSLDEKNYPLDQILEKLLTYTENEYEYIYLQVTRGTYLKREHIFPSEVIPTLFAYVTSFKRPQYETAKKGLIAITHNDIRWDRCDIKSISLLGNVLLKQLSHEQNADETILIRNQFVTEASVSNIFIVKNGGVITPPLSHSLLSGVTRHQVIELLKSLHISIEEKAITEEELRLAEEIWLTSATKEVAPVSLLDNKKVGDSNVYPVWEKIFKAYQAATAQMFTQTK